MGKDLKGKELGEGLIQHKEGYYSARFRGKDGKRYQRYSQDLDDLKRWMIDTKYSVEHDSIYAGGEMSVDKWFWFWLDEIKRDSIRHGTRGAYINRYNSRIKDVIGHM